MFVEQRNFDGWGRQLFGSVSTANFFQPQDDSDSSLNTFIPIVLETVMNLNHHLRQLFSTRVNFLQLSPAAHSWTKYPSLD